MILRDPVPQLPFPFSIIEVIIFHFIKALAPESFKNLKIVKLAILGPNEAGKTTLWNYIMNKPSSKVYKETEGSVRMRFYASDKFWDAIKPENSNIEVKFFGDDINGNGDFMRRDWERLINDSNMILFVFNASKYLKYADYQRDINQRIQFVKSTIDKRKDGQKREVWILGSYADMLSNRKDDWNKIIGIINKKPYCDISHNNACLNLTKEEELMCYCKKIFGI
jgi:GTPase SAR1 family protein